MPIKIRFAFTGFILRFKMSLITNRTHREVIISARGGLIFGETYVYNWGPYKWRRGGGGLVIGYYGMRVFLARLLNVMTDWVQVS